MILKKGTIIDYFGSVALDQIKPSHVEAFKGHLKENRGISGATLIVI
jgi:hypothetical protein